MVFPRNCIWLIAASLTLSLPAAAQSADSKDGIHPIIVPDAFAPLESNFTIVGGTLQTTRLPWFVSILSCDADLADCNVCGASLVNSDIILTAAHCVDIHKLVPSVAIAGPLFVDYSTLQSDGTQIFPVPGSLVIHPDWDEGDFANGNDIAMFKISPASINSFVPLNSDTSVPSNGQPLNVFGFGRTVNDDPSSGSNFLLRLDPDAQTPCEVGTTNFPDRHTCTLADPTTSGACQGDSGGPLLTSADPNTAVQVGLASYVYTDPANGISCAIGRNDVFTDVAFHDSWIQQYICDNSASPPSSCNPDPSPTPSPDPNPTPSPTADPTTDPCFSEVATVEVLGEGSVAMKDLQVGAKIFTGTNKGKQKIYQPVYSFGHLNKDQTAEFLRIYTSASSKAAPLEITGNHLLYIAGVADPVRADTIKAGDKLRQQSSHNDYAEQEVKVTRIQKILRQGAYQPLTPDGTLVVSGIHVSAYASDDDSEVFSDMLSGLMTQQTLFHWWLSPFRMLCLGVSLKMGNGPYSSNGLVYWYEIARRLLEFFYHSNGIAKVLLASLFLTLLGVVNLAEMTFGPCLGCLVLAGAGIFLVWRLLVALKVVALKVAPMEKMKTI